MLTHRNLIANVLQSVAAEGDLARTSVLVGVLPMYHIYGMQCIMNCGCLYQGTTLVTLPKYNLKDFLEVCQSKFSTSSSSFPRLSTLSRVWSHASLPRPSHHPAANQGSACVEIRHFEASTHQLWSCSSWA